MEWHYGKLKFGSRQMRSLLFLSFWPFWKKLLQAFSFDFVFVFCFLPQGNLSFAHLEMWFTQYPNRGREISTVVNLDCVITCWERNWAPVTHSKQHHIPSKRTGWVNVCGKNWKSVSIEIFSKKVWNEKRFVHVSEIVLLYLNCFKYFFTVFNMLIMHLKGQMCTMLRLCHLISKWQGFFYVECSFFPKMHKFHDCNWGLRAHVCHS